MSQVKPALTAEEWDGGETAWPTIALQTTSGGHVNVWNGEVGENDSQYVQVSENDRHALAALCLHEQPFGFDREDVEKLRRFRNDCYKYDPSIGGVRRDWLRSLADRIEVLLPPEEVEA